MHTSRLLEALPGISMPVSEVTANLAHMWDARAEEGGAPASDFRALQMNLILHFGMRTSIEEGVATFNTAIAFAQRYPCRIIVLCPESDPGDEPVIESKLFSQCYIGKNLRDQCCCEALIIGYSPQWPDFLENQVSLWLDADLPIYYWLHRVKADRVRDKYLSFFKRCRRILFDSARDGNDYEGLDWPDPAKTRDLAWARTLPLRQNIGQLLSSFPPEVLVDGLSQVTIRANENLLAEGKHLIKWHQNALDRCLQRVDSSQRILCRLETSEREGLEVKWVFQNQNKFFTWEFNMRSHIGRYSWDFGRGRIEQPLHIEPIHPQNALAEAFFFG